MENKSLLTKTATTLSTMKSDFSMASILLESKRKERLTPQLPCGLENLKSRSTWLKINNQIPLPSSVDDVSCRNTKRTINERVTGLTDDQDALVERERIKNARVKLDDSDLWKSFHHLTNEMIVTKNGRYVFPKDALQNLFVS